MNNPTQAPEVEFQALLTDNTRLNIDADFLRKDRDRLAEENEGVKAVMGELVEALREINKRAKNAMKQCADGVRPFVALSDIYTVSEQALTAYEQQKGK